MVRMTRSSGVLTVAGLALACLLAAPAASYADTSCTVLADAATGRILSQDGTCDRPTPPASTFKIAIALMGYDSGFLTSETAPTLPFKKGYPDWRKEWRTDINPTSWMKESVVWYSQAVTRALGMERFASYVRAFDYGNHDVSGDAGKDNGLMRAWLSSSLRITPLQQIDFVGRLVRRDLPVSAHAYAMTEAILEAHDLPNGWTVRGKTGTGFAVNKDGSANRKRPFGWYVGWASRGDRTVLFARLRQFTQPQPITLSSGERKDMLARLPAALDALPSVTD